MFALTRSLLTIRYSLNFLLETQIQRSCVLFDPYKDCQFFHTNNVLSKKRLTEEEKKLAKTSKKFIRYPLKSKHKNEVIGVWRNMTVAEVAEVSDKSIDQVFEAMLYVKDSENYSKKTSIIDNPQVIYSILKIFGYRYKIISKPDEPEEIIIDRDAVRNPPAPVENLKPRPPVVTVMGHVDHGKTTLLDSLRDSNVVEKEFGGITQHIGAFSVKLSSGDLVTFLDTPGHAAFSAMRARGANATDIVVLVVAADDGVMEQTIESIRMAKEAKVPIIVAVNKIDKPTADIDRTKKMLAQQGILVEDLGGEVQAIPISALKKKNLETLVEAIGLQAQIMDLKADPTGFVEGVIVEAETDQRRGKLATVIVQRGTLRKGCILVAGLGWARTRAMFSSEGSPVMEAPPSTPVQVLGWRELPSAGDEMLEVKTEKRASEVMRWRSKNKMQEKQQEDAVEIAKKEAEHREVYEAVLKKKRLLGKYKLRREGPRQKMFVESNDPTLNIVIKGDVDGSVEAILDALETYDDHSNCKLDVVHYGIGNITENDVEMAEMFKGIVYAFNVECLPYMSSVVKSKNITIKYHNVIYKMIDDIKEEINLRIPLTQKEEEIGAANILENFEINEKRKKVFVAGCRCVRGVLKKNAMFKVLRGEEMLYDGKLESMRHLKDEVDSIKKDTECGLKFGDKTIEFKPGDTVVCYHMIDVRNTTNWNPGF